MKKVLALVLAATLALGTATVAFATGNPNLAEKDEKYLDVRFANAYVANDDDKVVDNNPISFSGTIEPGEVVYFEVYGGKATLDNVDVMDSGTPTGVKRFSNVSDLSDYRISYSIDDGKNMVKSAKFVKAKATSDSKYHLYVAVEMNDNFIMEDTSLDMTLKVSSKNGAYVGENGTGYAKDSYVERDIATTLSYDAGDVGNGYYTVPENGAVLSFDDDADDVTLCFDEDVEVAGNMKGQKDIFVRLATSNSTIEDKYPDATLRFFDGNKDTFKRDVTVTIPYESAVEKPYLYLVESNGALTKLYGGSNADKAAAETSVKYDDVAGAFTFNTKTLNNYIISDTELKSNVSTDKPSGDSSSDVENSDKPTDGTTQPNPGTGANDFVGLAVALAVVSVAGLAVVKRK